MYLALEMHRDSEPSNVRCEFMAYEKDCAVRSI